MGKPAGRSRLRRVTVRRRLFVERLADRRVLAAISGAVFEDSNFSFQRDEDESNLPGRLVFLDANANERLDAGEPLTVADGDGSFKFEDLDDGNYLVRMFHGTSSQLQTTPVQVSAVNPVAEVENSLQFSAFESGFFALDGQAVSVFDSATRTVEKISLGEQLTRMQTLPDGRVLVVGSDPAGESSWLVNLSDRTAAPFQMAGQASTTGWADLALDGHGRGVLLEQSGEPFAIRAIAAAQDGSLHVATTSTMVPADTQVLSSDSGNRSVLAWSGEGGLQLALWSNVTAMPITHNATTLEDASQLLAFDDDAGLLAVRTVGGGVRVHDVDGNFAPLHTWEDLTGPIAMDAGRQLLVSITPNETILKMISLKDGGALADLAVDLSAIGPVTSLSLADQGAVQVLGAAGIAEIALRKPAAHQVTITGGQDPDPVLFGVAVQGANTAPSYEEVPAFETDEDATLLKAAPAALQVSSDADGDQYVLVQRGAANYGVAVVEVDGQLTYSPNPDFYGNDQVTVILHDGRDASEEVNLNIRINPVADSPSSIHFDLDPVPQNAQVGSSIGNIEIIDADGIDNLVIEVLDPRFGVDGNEIIFLGGQMDFQAESQIQVPLVVSDPETGDRIERIFALTITDSNDPIQAISPDEATVTENDEGGFVAFIGVDDGDDKHSHTVTVDDQRFEVVGNELRLVSGVALDFEAEPTILIHLTATENVRNPHSLTEPVIINVGDVLEQPQSIQLSNETVLEKSPGHVVGDVLIDGNPVDPRLRLSVDDSRFEIVQGKLKLHNDQIVEHASQSEIQLKITAQDSQRVFSTLDQSFVIQVLKNATPFHNHEDPFDVNQSGTITALDALSIINYLNIYGPGPVQPTNFGHFYDVNADTLVTALDALLILNEMNREPVNGTVGSGEGERVPVMPNTAVPSGGKQQDEVFDLLGRDDETVSSFQDGRNSSDANIELETSDPESDDGFVESVDQSIRLFSDEPQ